MAFPAAAQTLSGLRVSGAHLIDGSGRRVALRGVNRAGNEYACVQGFGIFDGPSDEASVAAIASWHVNFVRVLLNEDCWLGINGVKPRLRRPQLPPGDRQLRASSCTATASTPRSP